MHGAEMSAFDRLRVGWRSDHSADCDDLAEVVWMTDEGIGPSCHQSPRLRQNIDQAFENEQTKALAVVKSRKIMMSNTGLSISKKQQRAKTPS
jgi:hypothetical protein